MPYSLPEWLLDYHLWFLRDFLCYVGFQEVSDSHVAVRKFKEVVLESEQQVSALREQKSLANDRFYGGVAPYLEVLDSDQQLFNSELQLTQNRANQLLAVIALYRALGGGWQTEDTLGPKTKS